MSRPTRNGTAEPNSPDQTLRREREKENPVFPVQLTTNRIGNHTQLMPSLLKVMTTHTTVIYLAYLLLEYSDNPYCYQYIYCPSELHHAAVDNQYYYEGRPLLALEHLAYPLRKALMMPFRLGGRLNSAKNVVPI